MSSDRRSLWQPFFESATDVPVADGDQARLAPVERVPFLEPPGGAGAKDEWLPGRQ